MKYLILCLCVFSLVACQKSGNETETPPIPGTTEVSNPKAAKNGYVLLTIDALETVSMSQGLIRECHVTIDIQNSMKSSVRRLSIEFLPVTDDDFDQAVLNATSAETIYLRDIKRGKSVDEKVIRGMGCEGFKAMSIQRISCSTKDGACGENAVKLTGGDLVSIVELSE